MTRCVPLLLAFSLLDTDRTGVRAARRETGLAAVDVKAAAGTDRRGAPPPPSAQAAGGLPAPALPPPAAAAALTPEEQGRLERDPRLDRRVRVYEAASARLQQAVEKGLAHQAAFDLEASLGVWSAVLKASLADIQARSTPRKRSRAVIRYEIALRKSIAAVRKLALTTPDHSDAFEAWLASADEVHKGLVELIFEP